MMDMIWHYTGSLDESGRVLTLDSEGPAMDGSGRIVRMQDILEIGIDGERMMRGEQQMEDGSWTEFMRMRYSRIGRGMLHHRVQAVRRTSWAGPYSGWQEGDRRRPPGKRGINCSQYATALV